MWRIHHGLENFARRTRPFSIQLGLAVHHYGTMRVFLREGRNDMGNMCGKLREDLHENHQQRLLSHEDASVKGHKVHWMINEKSEWLAMPDSEDMLSIKERKKRRKKELKESNETYVKGLVLGLRLMKRLEGQTAAWTEVRRFEFSKRARGQENLASLDSDSAAQKLGRETGRG